MPPLALTQNRRHGSLLQSFPEPLDFLIYDGVQQGKRHGAAAEYAVVEMDNEYLILA